LRKPRFYPTRLLVLLQMVYVGEAASIGVMTLCSGGNREAVGRAAADAEHDLQRARRGYAAHRGVRHGQDHRQHRRPRRRLRHLLRARWGRMGRHASSPVWVFTATGIAWLHIASHALQHVVPYTTSTSSTTSSARHIIHIVRHVMHHIRRVIQSRFVTSICSMYLAVPPGYGLPFPEAQPW